MNWGVILAIIVLAAGSASPAWAAQLGITIVPEDASSPFEISYQSTAEIGYEEGGSLSDALTGKSWAISGVADSSHPAVQDMIDRLNAGIRSDRSQASVSDLTVTYDFSLNPRVGSSSSIDYSVVLEGVLTGYVITADSQKTLIDLGWRALSIDGPVVIDGTDINIPLNIIRDQEPEAYALFADGEAGEILTEPIINSDFILEHQLGRWHFLFDPTGIVSGSDIYKPGAEIEGKVFSQWTMGESSIGGGIHVPKVSETEITSDVQYTLKVTRPPDSAAITVIGFGNIDTLDGIEIAGVSQTVPEGYQINPSGQFPSIIVYGMAGLAAVAGVGFFVFSNRSLKNEKKGQQGVDPTHLVGYQTSSSSGGYQTNRGEAQLRGDSTHQQTRTMYEDPVPQAAEQEAACGCAASAEMGSECDCAMQGSCLCDGTCRCGAILCKEHSDLMR